MKQYDSIIIGAGISGLSLAHYCAKAGLQTIVLEKNRKPGGCFCSHKFDGDASDFWLELCAHTCYNSYGNLIGIVEECGILDRIVKREKVGFKMFVNGGITSIPSQINFLELLLSVPRMFGLKKEGETIKSYYAKIVGKRNYEKVFGPAFTAVISQNADDFPADLLFKKRPRRKDVLKSFTFTNGLQTITDAIAAEKGVEVKTGSEVQAITFRDGIFEVSVSGGERIEAKSLALASPPDVAAKLLRPSFPEVAGVLSEIGVESIETVGVAIRKNALSLSPLAGLIAVEDAFYSAVSRDTVPHGSYRGFSFHFKAGGTDEASKLRRMSEILKVERGLLEQVASRESVLPSLRVNHPALVDRIDRVVAGKKLLLTGNYFLGLAIEDCVSRSLSEFARLKTLL